MLVFAVFVAIVPVRPAKEYVRVCVKLEEARVMVILVLLAMLAFVAVTVLVLGMVSRDTVPVAGLRTPSDEMLESYRNSLLCCAQSVTVRGKST